MRTGGPKSELPQGDSGAAQGQAVGAGTDSARLRRLRAGTTLLTGVWNAVIVLTATVAAILAPAHVVGSSELISRFDLYDAIFTVVFLADVVVRIRLLRGRPGLRETALLVCDLLAALPLHLLTGSAGFALVRLLKLPRLVDLGTQWRYRHLQRWNMLRLVYFVYWLGLCVHWLSCGWLTLHGMPANIDATTAYVRSLYWCFSTLTTIGYADNMPKTNPEIIYSIIVMIFGVGTYGYVIGNVANILVNMDPAHAGYFEHMEKLSSFMNYREIPPELQRRVRDYHSYVWEHRLGYNEETILDGLPPTLMTDVSMFLKRDVIQHVPFFATASDQLLRDIAHAMHPVVYMPGDVIFHEGDRGDAMYFISRGKVEVYRSDGDRVAILTKGDAVGEMALVLNKPRVASVRAIGYCDLYKLDKATFSKILDQYPEFADHVRALTRQRNSTTQRLRT